MANAARPYWTQTQPGKGDYQWNPYNGTYTYVDPRSQPNYGTTQTLQRDASLHGITNFAPDETGMDLANAEALTSPTKQQAQYFLDNQGAIDSGAPWGGAPSSAAPAPQIPAPVFTTQSRQVSGPQFSLSAPTSSQPTWGDQTFSQFQPSTSGSRGLTAFPTSGATPAGSAQAMGSTNSPQGAIPSQPNTPSSSASSQFTPLATSQSFDAGGDVQSNADGDNDNISNLNAGADPLSTVKSALQYGRQKLGLIPRKPAGSGGDKPNGNPFPTKTPATPFGKRTGAIPTDDDTQALADGGDVDADEQQPAIPDGQQPQVPPQQTARYLMGADAVPPEMASAMEQHIDPQGTMDPSQRVLAAVSQGRTPDEQFGLMQAYRQKFNRYQAFARAALKGVPGKPGDIAAAARAATQAYANVPDGTSMTFQPHQGGVAVQVKRIAGKGNATQPQQGYDDGGDVSAGAPDPFSNEGGNASGDLSALSGVGPAVQNAAAAVTHFLSPSGFFQFLSGPSGSYDNTMDVGGDTAIKAVAPNVDRLADQPPLSPAPQEPEALDTAQAPPIQTMTGSGLSGNDVPPMSAGAQPGVTEGTSTESFGPGNGSGTGGGQVPPDIQQLANRLFPWAGDAEKRRDFIIAQMNAREERAGKLDVAKNTRLYGSQATAGARENAAQTAAASRENVQAQKSAMPQRDNSAPAKWQNFGKWYNTFLQQNQREPTPQEIAAAKKSFEVTSNPVQNAGAPAARGQPGQPQQGQQGQYPDAQAAYGNWQVNQTYATPRGPATYLGNGKWKPLGNMGQMGR